MFDFINRLFSTEGFPARWLCGPGWKDDPAWGWILIISDLAIWAAYLAIPAIIVYFLRQKQDLPFPRILWLFVAFIFACGTTHLVDALIFWWPAYRFQGILKAGTGIVSWATVISLVPLVPKLLRFKGPGALELEVAERTRQLQDATDELRNAVGNRERLAMQLHFKESRLQFALAAGRMGTWEWDLKSDLIGIDHAVQTLIGVSSDTGVITASEFMSLVHQEDVASLNAAMSSAIRDQGFYDHEFRLVLPSGECRWLGGRGEVIRDNDGAATKLCGVNYDVTDRKLTEVALRENQKRFQTIADNIAQFAWMTDEHGSIEWYNKRWFEYTGTTLDEMQGWGWRTVHHPDHVDRVVQRFSQCILEGADWEDTFPLRRHDGEYRWFLSRAKAIHDANGRVVRWFGTNTDVTEHLEIERMLRIRTRAIESATNGILIADAEQPDVPIVFANRAFEGMTGYAVSEALGRNCRFLQGADTSEEDRRTLREAIAGKTECHVTILNYRKDGTSFWNDLRVAPVEDESGHVSHFVGVQTDVSDRIQYEESLQAMRMGADSANQAKSEFLANMSHEIRTPLTAILGCADALYRQGQNEDSRDLSRMIRDQGQLLLGILNDVLDLSKIDAGRLEIHREQCELVRIVSHVESLLRPLATDKGLDLVVFYETLVPEQFETAPLRLRQILLNLVSNAIKFTEAGSIRVSIACRTEPGLDALRIDVADSGIGIFQDRLQSIFEPFIQETRSKTQNASGTGLGLTICRRLAEMLGGTISVQSRLNEGSCFRLLLPISDMSHTTFCSAEELLGRAKRQDSSGELDLLIPIRVLVAEDTRAVQFMMKRLLESFVGSVVVVENGQLAVEAMQESITVHKPFNLILMDMQMPVLNGFDATHQLRSLGIQTPIIALTAGAMSGDREKCLSAGCNDYLSKPVHRDELVAIVQKHGRQIPST